MATLVKNELPLKRFHFDKGAYLLTAEASDFGPGLSFFNSIYQLYDDACDMGIAIRSEITGRTELFWWQDDLGKNDDYATGYDRYVFTPVSGLANVVQVIVFND